MFWKKQREATRVQGEKTRWCRRLMMHLLITVLMAGSVLFAGTYSDPQGRFSIPTPKGWTATAAGEGVRLSSGSAYAVVMIIPDGGNNPRRVAEITDGFGQQWRNYRRLQN